ncbi:MAG: DUF4231 domain-containing protein [Leptolyngbyaceae cyanobacterium]
MATKDPYREFLQQDFGQLFEAMELKETQRHFLRSRWLDQVLWMEKKATLCRDRHYRLRLTTIVLGVLVPILIGIDVQNPRGAEAKKYLTIGLSAVVAVSSAIEEFFHYGERWYHYRRTVESLKTQGWQFSQLTGSYAKFPSHKVAFSDFADQVEAIIQKDVEIYVTQVAKPDEEKSQQGEPIQAPDEEEALA